MDSVTSWHKYQLNATTLTFAPANLYRRYYKDTVNVVLKAMKAGIYGSSTNLGYLSIHQKLGHNCIKTDRETVGDVCKL